MMTRTQRIEYEILDCALNRANTNEGYSSSVNMFFAVADRFAMHAARAGNPPAGRRLLAA